MIDIRLKLSVLWVALMLIYLLGDVIRIFAGDFDPGVMGDATASQAMYLGVAILMLLPIVMAVLTILVPFAPWMRWASIGVSALLFLFNLVGLPTYPGLYDRFLIAVGLGVNVLTVTYAWRWV